MSEGRIADKDGTNNDPWTMAHLAAAVGVSIATVSRALNRPEMVAENTRKAIVDAARELSFYPNRTASGLRSGLHKCLALLVADISQPWYAKIAMSIEGHCDERGFGLQLHSYRHDITKMLSYLARAPFEGVDGVFLNTGDHLKDPRIRASLTKLINSGIPVVSIGQKIPRLGIPSVTYDDVHGAEEATRHLLETSGLPLAFLGAISGSALADARLRGFKRAIANTAEPDKYYSMVTVGYSYEAGYEAMSASLNSGLRPHGVLAANDQLALGAIRAITDFGAVVGSDISVVGFGDVDFAQFTTPSISSVGGSTSEIGRAACDQLIARVLGQDMKNRSGSVVVRRELVIRESSRSLWRLEPVRPEELSDEPTSEPVVGTKWGDHRG